MTKEENKEKIRAILARLYSMKTRCYNKKVPQYKNYGGRGIKVCEEWMNDKNKFVEWSLKNGFKKELTIDRIDNSSDYNPNNCRWVDRKTQNNNKRNTKKHKCFNEFLTITEASEKYGISFKKLETRVNRGGLNLEEAVKIGNIKKQKKDAQVYIVDNEEYTLKDLEKLYNVKKHTIYERLARGMSLANSLYQPKSKMRVNQFTKERVLINTYSNITEASKQTNVVKSNICACCNGIRKTAGGFIWQFQ